MVTKAYKDAFTEVIEILNCLNDEDYNKIPKKIIQAIRSNMNEEYEYFIDETKSLEEQKMLPETKAILFNFFRDYLSTREQREEILLFQKYERLKLEQEKREKYNPDDIFKKADKQRNINNELSKDNFNKTLIEYKESFFTRFKNFILKILHINK